jgi:hypothetical protein
MTSHSMTHAFVQDLSTRLMAGATATATLLAWCEEHGLSQGPITTEVRQRFSPSVVPDNVLTALEPAPGTTIHIGRFSSCVIPCISQRPRTGLYRSA